MATQNDRTKFLLGEHDIPKAWYNILADLPGPLPPVLHPVTLKPVGPEDLAPLFPMGLIMQEVSPERYIEIPEPVREMYKLYRPSPLIRARRLEQLLDTPARIYYKYEGVSPAGSHKLNTAIAQAFFNKQEGVKKLATETGAGQWGSALSMAGAFLGIEVEVFMVKVSYQQKPYRRMLMEAYGGTVHPSPSPLTAAGRSILEHDPDSPGSLGIAISEAVEDAATHDDTNYSLGSVLNHVMLHQTVIGLECKAAFRKLGLAPDVLIGCAGGGSNFAGLAFPFVPDKLDGQKMRIIAVEPEACPSLTRGWYDYDHGDVAGMTPKLKMYTLGHTFIPPAIHAGGLRYHGMAPLVSKLVNLGVIEAMALPQTACFEGAMLFAQTEGVICAPESSHAVRAAINIARECKQTGEAKTILFNLSGHGHLDMSAYQAYMGGQLTDVVCELPTRP